MRSLRPCLRLLCQRLAWRLSLLLLVGLSACGPAPSDHAPSLEPRASLGGPSEPQPTSHNNPVTPAADPVPLASNPVPVPGQKEVAVQGSEPPEDEEDEEEEKDAG